MRTKTYINTKIYKIVYAIYLFFYKKTNKIIFANGIFIGIIKSRLYS